ncbi:AAA family ATPase [Dokdonella fugitiva]|uniref:AAA family ATPase n=1 Tax=Dokdonella fugitiva TaxID=328517 RepID=UPI0015FC97A5|nr:ATP-binding protein [Dokdonella fugitiva]MBA8885521.1 putative kinase [Dokdonella fugitiva]
MNDDDPPAPEARTGAPPLAVALVGLPGAGKSTVARALVAELGLRRVCRDEVRAAMFPQCEYSFIEKRAAYRGALLAIEINALLGASSVIDGMTFSRREDYERLRELAHRQRFSAMALVLECTPALARRRVADDVLRRAHPARDRSPELVDAVAARFDAPPADAVRIDASLPADAMCRRAVDAVRARLSGAPA